jgi:hypothetical protein
MGHEKRAMYILVLTVVLSGGNMAVIHEVKEQFVNEEVCKRAGATWALSAKDVRINSSYACLKTT